MMALSNRSARAEFAFSPGDDAAGCAVCVSEAGGFIDCPVRFPMALDNKTPQPIQLQKLAGKARSGRGLPERVGSCSGQQQTVGLRPKRPPAGNKYKKSARAPRKGFTTIARRSLESPAYAET